MFVTGINCPTVRAYEQMMLTKRRYGKSGGNVAYHGYQSFKIGEVTPEEAHKIGLEIARRMWGKDYEMVVTTHLNTENIHNHIVVNSVSFKTGLKFENHIRDHIKLREISDDVCREFNKSVLENAKFYKSDKKLYWIKKNGKLTHRDILKQGVDDAIKESGNLMEFDRIMHIKGYTFNRKIGTKHPSVIAKGWEKPIRIDSLGDDYTTERIIETISKSELELEKAEQQNIDMRLLLKALRELTDFRELTPTIVNSLIQRIEVHNNDKYDGHCHVKVDIYFTAVGMIDIPDEKEILDIINKIQENPRMNKVE